MKLTLVDNWRTLHKRGTVIISAACAAITAFGPSLINAWNTMPPDLKAALPQGTERYVSLAVFLLLIIGRYTTVKRNPPKEDDNDTP
ncbi:DUF7940 domain-containing protein [Pseudomonas sp. MDT1-85]